jgi:transposase InsO family protein
MQPTMTAQLVMDALLMAIFRRGRPQAVLHHSDQGNTPANIFSACSNLTASFAA